MGIYFSIVTDLPVGGRVCFFQPIVVYWELNAPIGRDAWARINNSMQTIIEETPILQKTRELCQTILDQPNVRSIRERIDAFMGDQQARTQYDGLVSKGQALQQKQQMSVPLSGEEISDFEQHRDSLLHNPVARGFLDAQEELHEVQQSIQKYVNKTLELGRLPTEDELNAGGCGEGCGCGHGH